MELWSPSYEDPSSDEYRNIADQIQRAVEQIYDENKSDAENKIYANVIKIE